MTLVVYLMTVQLTINRPGAKGALLLHSAASIDEFGEAWPAGVPLQIHTMENDDWGDVDVAKQVVEAIDTAELFLYPGDKHLFADSSLSDYTEDAAKRLTQRVLAFLGKLDSRP